MNKLATALARIITAMPRRVIALLVLIPILLSPGLTNLRFNDDYRVYFSEDNVDLVAWEKLLNTYSRTDPLIVTLEAPEGQTIFSPGPLRALRELTDELWHVKYVTRVDSVANFQHIEASEEEITVADLIVSDRIDDPAFREERRKIALQEPRIKDSMLSSDGRVTAIQLQLMIPKTENAIADAAAEVRAIQDKYEQKYAGIDIRLGGIVMLNAAFDEYARADMGTLFPLMVLVFQIMITLLFRTARVTLAIAGTIVLTMLSTFGATGLIGIEFSPHSSIAPHVILTICVATSVHVALSFLQGRARYESASGAIEHTLRQNLYPITLCSITTAIGFLSMLYSEVPPFRHLGIMCSLGVLFAFINTLIFIPAALSLMKLPQAETSTSAMSRWCAAYGQFLLNHKARFAFALVLPLALSLFGLSRLEVDDHPVKMFEKGTEFRDDADFIDQHLAGTTDIHFSLDTGKQQGISDPKFLAEVEEFKQFLIDDPLVNHVAVISDTLKRINKALHNDDPHFYKTGDSHEANAQALLFYETNLPFGQEINNEINIEKSSTRLVATIASSSSSQVIEFLERTHAWIDEQATSFTSRGVSVLVMFSYMIERLSDNMIENVFLSIGLMAIALSLSLRSLRLGIVSMIPNLLPTVVVFGFWSLAGQTLDFAAVLIFAMTLGVVVDDTVHFISKYIHLSRNQGYSSAQAIIETFRSVGPALITSTVVLSTGFMVLTLSSFHMNVTLGLLSSLTFMVALVFDFLMLALLLHSFGPKYQASALEIGEPANVKT